MKEEYLGHVMWRTTGSNLDEANLTRLGHVDEKADKAAIEKSCGPIHPNWPA